MFKKLGLIILSVVMVLSMATASGASTNMLYYEDFSGYAVGTLPSGWSIVASGAGDSEQGIADSSGNNVLLAKAATDQSAALRRGVGTVPDTIIFSFSASIPSGGYVSIGNGTQKVKVSTAAANQWANYSLTIDFAAGVYDLSVNGALKKSGAGLSQSSSTGITINTGHNTGNETAMIDNILILEVIEETYSYYSHNTVSSFGPHFRDVSPELTDKWYMFTPLDLSQDGTQTFPLVGGGVYIIGQLYVTVYQDTVTISYQYVNDDIWPEGDFFTIFPDYGSITTVTPEDIDSPFQFGMPISIANDLAGDTDVILFVRNVVTFRDDNPKIVRFWENTPENKAWRETLLDMIQ